MVLRIGLVCRGMDSSRVKLLDDILSAKHSTLISYISLKRILGLLQTSFTNCSAFYNGLDIISIQLFCSLRLQIDKIIWHLSHMQSETDSFLQLVAVVNNEWLVLSVDVVEHFVVNCIYFISLPLKAEIWQVFAPVNPVSYCSLNFVYNRYQNFLNHFRI